MRERHLPSGSLHHHTKPTLLIAPARAALVAADRAAPRAAVEHVAAALQRGGDVLMPTDVSGRCLELLLVLDSHWRAHRELCGCPIVLLHAQARSTLAFARSQVTILRCLIHAMRRC